MELFEENIDSFTNCICTISDMILSKKIREGSWKFHFKMK